MGINCQFDEALARQIESNLSAFTVCELDRSGKKHAAVAFTLVSCRESAGIGDIPLVEGDDLQAGFVLTTRAAKLSAHAGQRAFPGGRIDPGESIEQAALRELHEEVGIELESEQILGRLDDYSTRSGFVISPVVVWAQKNDQMRANPAEVEQVHRIPLRELLREDAPILEAILESDEPVIKMPIGNDWFAAPTAAIAYQFREVALLGKQTRVAHYDQPRFAWQ